MSDYLSELKTEVLESSEVKSFIKKFNLSSEEIDNSIIMFYQYLNAKKLCAKCKSLDACALDSDGMKPELRFDGFTRLVDKPCKHYKCDPDNLVLLNYEGDIDTGELYINDARYPIIQKIASKAKDNPKKGKGLYIYGKNGTGKTNLLLRFACQFSKNGLKTVFVYYPEFASTIKMNVGKVAIDPIIEVCKTADILIIDDIGGEKNSQYLRDDVLERILNYRMMCNMPVYFSSNYDYDALNNHFASSFNDYDKVASARIIERIKATSEPIELKDKNYRN